MKLKGEPTGALVGEVAPNTPSQKAGIKTGDVITAVNGKKINDARELRLMIGSMAPGTKVRSRSIGKVKRKRSMSSLPKCLRLPPRRAPRRLPKKVHSLKKPLFSVVSRSRISLMTSAARSIFPKEVQGAVIAEIDTDSPAAKAGLHEGDVIQEVNKQPVKNAKDLVAVSKKLKPNEKILTRVYSQGRSGYVALEPK